MSLIFYFTVSSIPLLLLLSSHKFIRLSSLYIFSSLVLLSYHTILICNKSIIWYQLIFRIYCFDYIQVSLIIGYDSLSLYFILLCAFLLYACIVIYWYLRYWMKWYSLLLSGTIILLINVFLALDVFLFYVFYEAIILPMFLIIGIWGSRFRKIYAAYQLFLYTLVGSILILIGLISIQYNSGTTSFDLFGYTYLFTNRQFWLWLLIFIGLSVKIPIIPLHIWLPEAHVEAPTPGSVILAGILLKLGAYAIIRLLTLSFYNAGSGIVFLVFNIGLIGFIHAAMAAYGQIDIKKIIAYSSVSHMNFALLGLFSYSILGLAGFFHLMFGHAITSGALFLGIGVLYDRYKTRLIFYYGQLVIFMPLMSILFFILILSNFGFPGTSNFVGEFLISCGIYSYVSVIMLLAALPLVYTLIYSLVLYNKIFFGLLSEKFIRYFCDTTRLECYLLITFAITVLALGLIPNTFFDISFVSLIKISYYIL